MPYATRDDLDLAYGADTVDRCAIRPEDPDGSQTVARALDHASNIIDAELSTRFVLPFDPVPSILVVIACDLALARLASIDAMLMTDNIRDREKVARADLKRIADGQMNLGLPSAGPTDSPRPVLGRVTSGPDKMFTRERTRGL